MIASVAGPVNAPVHVRPVPPAVEPVAPVAPAAGAVGVGPDSPGGAGSAAAGSAAAGREAAGRTAARSLDSPPEPVSTQSVLLLRQNGASIAGIAEAYGLSVESVRRLMQSGHEPGSAPAAG